MVAPADSASLSYTVFVRDTAVGGNQAPEFTMDSYTFNISENVANEDEVGDLSVTDNDGIIVTHVHILEYIHRYDQAFYIG